MAKINKTITVFNFAFFSAGWERVTEEELEERKIPHKIPKLEDSVEEEEEEEEEEEREIPQEIAKLVVIEQDSSQEYPSDPLCKISALQT